MILIGVWSEDCANLFVCGCAGLRCLYFAAPLTLWLFGGMWLLLAVSAWIPAMWSLDHMPAEVGALAAPAAAEAPLAAGAGVVGPAGFVAGVTGRLGEHAA